MENILNFAKTLVYWTIPRGIYYLATEKYINYRTRLSKENRPIISKNLVFYNIHIEERCFILATGPSIKEQNLAVLKDEYCFAVSDFFKHLEYQTIRPAYYCITPIHRPLTVEDLIKRLYGLKEHGHKDETYFFGLRDKDMVEKSNLAADARGIYYLNFQHTTESPIQIDLAKTCPPVTSVSIMALWVAIYMGFSEIYLLGCDHNHIWQWDGTSNVHNLDHFFEGAPPIGYGSKSFVVDQSLRAHLKVREQYRWANQVAQNKGIKIFNASPTSYIDIFPRVNLDEVIRDAQ